MKTGKNKYCTLYLVRHGQTKHNVKKLLQGHSDSVLTKRGTIQAQELGRKLKDIKFDVVFSSDLTRAKRTAELILLEKKIAVKTTQVLRERHYGRFDGTPIKKYVKELRGYLDSLQKKEHQIRYSYKFPTEPTIESDEELMNRFIPFIREVAIAYMNKNVLIVTHGGVIRTFLIHLGFGTYDELGAGTVKNAAHMKIESDGVDFFVKEVFGVEKKS